MVQIEKMEDKEPYKTAIFIVLKHRDKDKLCSFVSRFYKELEEQGIEYDVQGFMSNDACLKPDPPAGYR